MATKGTIGLNKSPSTDQFPWSPIEVIQVNIVPHEIEYVGKTGRVLKKRIRIGEAARGRALEYAKHFENGISYYRQIKNAPNLFTIAIGVWDSVHKGSDLTSEDGETYEGSDLPYEDLFSILYNGIRTSGGQVKNYDPLRIVREGRKHIDDAITDKVLHLYAMGADGRALNKKMFESSLKVIGNEWLEKVKNYISGGEAPNLSTKTVEYFRPMKGVNHSIPLLSSGQLIKALKMRVYVEQTAEFRHHAEIASREMEKAKVVAKRWADIEKHEKKIRRSGRVTADISHESSLVSGIEMLSNARKQSIIRKPDVLDELESVLSQDATPKKASTKSSVPIPIITKHYNSGLLKDLTLSYRKDARTYEDILLQNKQHIARIANAWQYYLTQRQIAIDASQKQNSATPLNDWLSEWRKSGMYPDDRTQKLMEAAYEFLKRNGGEVK